MDCFSELSQEITKILDKDTKKNNGIFFTPKTYIHEIFKFLNKYNINPINILEPSFGSGEFFDFILKNYPNSNIYGIEINEIMYEKVKEKYPNLNLINENFIDYISNKNFDLIIGNPPYVVLKNENNDFKEISCGRPNLYCWFLYKSIKMLEDNGILVFILPNSILNTSFYKSLREFIVKKCNILNIIEFNKSKSDFKETEQNTLALFLQKLSSSEKNNGYFVVKEKGTCVFNINYEYLTKILSTYPSLKDYNILVKTGNIVWNQCKDLLYDKKNNDNKILIYTSNIKNGQFIYPKDYKNGKKQYIKSDKEYFIPPVILMNRGYGNSRYKLDLLFIDDNFEHKEFYVENHLNVIYPSDNNSKNLMEKIYKYLISEKNKEFIEKYIGNGALSKTEIQSILPIDI